MMAIMGDEIDGEGVKQSLARRSDTPTPTTARARKGSTRSTPKLAHARKRRRTVVTPGVKFLDRSKRGTRSVPAWIVGGNGLIDVLTTKTPSAALQTIEGAAGSEIGPIVGLWRRVLIGGDRPKAGVRDVGYDVTAAPTKVFVELVAALTRVEPTCATSSRGPFRSPEGSTTEAGGTFRRDNTTWATVIGGRTAHYFTT
jgi:hypothetical protein